MVTHFFSDITHFDSKFFTTVKDLLIRPGFLSKEYMMGKRIKYLHPVRMYVFTSAIFFLIFFKWFVPETTINNGMDRTLSAKERVEYIKTLESRLKKDTGNKLVKKKLAMFRDTSKQLTVRDYLETRSSGLQISFSGNNYKTIREYDSAQQILPVAKRDGWFKRRLQKKGIEINTKYREDPKEAVGKLVESILHRLPYMLFVSLPLFALILKVVYIRRKEFYYSDHGVFAIHLYIFTFLQLLAVFSLSALEDYTGWGFISVLIFALFVLLFFYLYKAMRNFYGQRRDKTVLKFLLVSLCSLVMMLILFVMFTFFSAITL